MRTYSLTEEVKRVSTLHTTGLPDGEQSGAKNLSVVAADTIAYFPWLHRRTNRTFGKVISGFNTVVGKQDKKILPFFQEMFGKL